MVVASRGWETRLVNLLAQKEGDLHLRWVNPTRGVLADPLATKTAAGLSSSPAEPMVKNKVRPPRRLPRAAGSLRCGLPGYALRTGLCDALATSSDGSATCCIIRQWRGRRSRASRAGGVGSWRQSAVPSVSG